MHLIQNKLTHYPVMAKKLSVLCLVIAILSLRYSDMPSNCTRDVIKKKQIKKPAHRVEVLARQVQ